MKETKWIDGLWWGLWTFFCLVMLQNLKRYLMPDSIFQLNEWWEGYFTAMIMAFVITFVLRKDRNEKTDNHKPDTTV